MAKSKKSAKSTFLSALTSPSAKGGRVLAVVLGQGDEISKSDDAIFISVPQQMVSFYQCRRRSLFTLTTSD